MGIGAKNAVAPVGFNRLIFIKFIGLRRVAGGGVCETVWITRKPPGMGPLSI